MKIKSVKIKGLWSKYNINWELDPKVNILSGINGSGKTTLLDIIAELSILGKYRKSFSKNFKSVEIKFDNGYQLNFNRLKETFKSLEKKSKKDESIKQLVEDLKKDIGKNVDRIQQFEIEAGVTFSTKDSKKCNIDDILNNLKLDIVSTFDLSLKRDDEAIKLSEIKNTEINTDLDWEIYRLQEKYLNYQVNIGRKIEMLLLNKVPDKTELIEEIYRKKNVFVDIVNSLFKDTGKVIDPSNNRISFKCSTGETIEPHMLSSGEKQLLIILLKVLIQDDKPYILFMDEPEISLHIDWQKQLFSTIMKLNKNCQIITASHSPALIMDGWIDKVTEVNNIFE